MAPVLVHLHELVQVFLLVPLALELDPLEQVLQFEQSLRPLEELHVKLGLGIAHMLDLKENLVEVAVIDITDIGEDGVRYKKITELFSSNK